MEPTPSEVRLGAMVAALISLGGALTAVLVQAGDSFSKVNMVAVVIAILGAATNGLKDWYALRFRMNASRLLGKDEVYNPTPHYEAYLAKHAPTDSPYPSQEPNDKP